MLRFGGPAVDGYKIFIHGFQGRRTERAKQAGVGEEIFVNRLLTQRHLP
jgi:hypothetical protein